MTQEKHWETNGKASKGKKAASKGNVIRQVTCCKQLGVNFTGEFWEAVEVHTSDFPT